MYDEKEKRGHKREVVKMQMGTNKGDEKGKEDETERERRVRK